MLGLDDVFELSLWGLELIADTGASAGSEPAGRVDSVRRRGSWPPGPTPREARPAATATLTSAAAVRGPARVTDPFSPSGRLPFLASEGGTAYASRAAPRRRAGDAKFERKS